MTFETLIADTRSTIGDIIAPVMRITGFRFSRRYRRGDTFYHRVVYAVVDTVWANHSADNIRNK